MSTSACSNLANSMGTVANAMPPGSCSPTHFLPGWRWTFAPGSFSQKLGNWPGHFITYIILEVATFAFYLSDLCWKILTVLAQVSALLTHAILNLNKTIDSAFVAVGSPLSNNVDLPLIILIVLAIAFLGAVVFGRNHRRHLKNILIALVSLTILLTMLAASSNTATLKTQNPYTVQAPTNHAAQGTVGNTGSASWLLHEGLIILNPISGLLQKIDTNNVIPTTGKKPNCNMYVSTLNSAASLVGGNTPATNIEQSVSSLWLATEYKLFADAQFGITNGAGGRAACHWDEINTAQNSAEQQAIMAQAYTPGHGNFHDADLLDFGPATMNAAAGSTYVADTERLLGAWGICINTGGSTHHGWAGTPTFNTMRLTGNKITWGYYCDTFWNATSNWGQSGSTTASPTDGQNSTVPTNPVSSNYGAASTGTVTWHVPFTGSETQAAQPAVSYSAKAKATCHTCGTNDPFYYNNPGSVTAATTKTANQAASNKSGSKPVNINTEAGGGSNNTSSARQFLESINGHIGLGGAISGFIALITSLAYLLAIGGLLLGLAAGTLGIVLWLILLPVWLILWAIPQSRDTAKRVTRLGMSVLLIQVFFGLVVTTLLLIMNIVTGIIDSLNIPDGSFLALLAPLIALMILRFGSKKLGIGKLSGLRGAMNMSMGAMRMSAAGRRDADAITKGKLGQKLDRLDSRAPLSRERIDKKRSQMRSKRREGWALAKGAKGGRKAQLAASKDKLPWYARLAVRSGAANRVWKARNMASLINRNKGDIAKRTLAAGAHRARTSKWGLWAQDKATPPIIAGLLTAGALGMRAKRAAGKVSESKVGRAASWVNAHSLAIGRQKAAALSRTLEKRYAEQGHSQNALAAEGSQKAVEIPIPKPAKLPFKLAEGVTASQAVMLSDKEGTFLAPSDGSHEIKVMAGSGDKVVTLGSVYSPEFTAAHARGATIMPGKLSVGENSELLLAMRGLQNTMAEGNRQRQAAADSSRERETEKMVRTDRHRDRVEELHERKSK